jgi:hypothetical protein
MAMALNNSEEEEEKPKGATAMTDEEGGNPNARHVGPNALGTATTLPSEFWSSPNPNESDFCYPLRALPDRLLRRSGAVRQQIALHS